MAGRTVYCRRVASDRPAHRFRPGQVVTVFRSRLRLEHREAYESDAADMDALARTMPGLVDFKSFTADDGERVTVVTFESEETQADWRRHVDHAAAQQRGRADYYAEYTLQVCTTDRVSEVPPG
jgi:heme-degrading monooxygenase HmoA